MRSKRALWTSWAAVAVVLLAAGTAAVVRHVRRPRFAGATDDLKRSLVAACNGRTEVLDRVNASSVAVVPLAPALTPTKTVRLIADDGRLTFAVPNGDAVDVECLARHAGDVTFGPAGAATPATHPVVGPTVTLDPRRHTLFTVAADPTDIRCPGAVRDYAVQFRSDTVRDYLNVFAPHAIWVRLGPPLPKFTDVLTMAGDVAPVLGAVADATGPGEAARRAIDAARSGLTGLGDLSCFTAVADARWADAVNAKTPEDFARTSLLLYAKMEIRYFHGGLEQLSNGRRTVFVLPALHFRDRVESGLVWFADGRCVGEGFVQCRERDYPSGLSVVRTLLLDEASPDL